MRKCLEIPITMITAVILCPTSLLGCRIQLLFGMAAQAPSPNLEASPRPWWKESGEYLVFNYFSQRSVIYLALLKFG